MWEKYKVWAPYKYGGNSLDAVGLSLENISTSMNKSTGNYQGFYEAF